MKQQEIRTRILAALSECAKYCYAVDQCLDAEPADFIITVSKLLPQIYSDFISIELEDSPEDYAGDLPSYLDEPAYESIKENLSRLLGENDTYLETFEEDMKYSDTPIAATISESLSDIYQPLYNFIINVKESGAEILEIAFMECKEDFNSYWSQTLCNVMRPLNNLRLTASEAEEN